MRAAFLNMVGACGSGEVVFSFPVDQTKLCGEVRRKGRNNHWANCLLFFISEPVSYSTKMSAQSQMCKEAKSGCPNANAGVDNHTHKVRKCANLDNHLTWGPCAQDEAKLIFIHLKTCLGDDLIRDNLNASCRQIAKPQI